MGFIENFVELSDEELKEAYKTNLTGLLLNVNDYLHEEYGRALALHTGDDELSCRVIVTHKNNVVFELSITKGQLRLLFGYYLRYTADRVVLPDSIDFDMIYFRRLNPGTSLNLTEYHIADFEGRAINSKIATLELLYQDIMNNSFFGLREDSNIDRIVVGEANGLVKPCGVVGFIPFYHISLDGCWVPARYQIRHLINLQINYMLWNEGVELDKLIDWLQDTKIDELLYINIHLDTPSVITYRESFSYAEDKIDKLVLSTSSKGL